MKVRVFTLPFDVELGFFDDEPVRQFLADQRLLAVDPHFFVHLDLPYLTLVLTYQPAGTGSAGRTAKDEQKARPRDHWRELLEPGQLPLFNTLREWRRQRARNQGIPPYVICTNHQLANVVRQRPQTIAGLAEIEGFGTAKIKDYGTEILGLLRPSPPEERSGDGR